MTAERALAPIDRPAPTAGSDAERRAALGVRDRLRAAGRAADLEPIRIRPRWALAQAIAAAAAVVGSVLSVSRPALGGAIVLAAAVSAAAEGTGLAHLALRLTGTRASQNVSAPGTGGRPGTLAIVAPGDVPRRSALTRHVHDPLAVLGTALGLLVACCVARLAGIDATALTVLQLLPTLLLVAALPLLIDHELAEPSPGEAQTAAVAAALALAERLDGELERMEPWVVVAGGHATLGQGLHAWLRRHRGELDRERTVVLVVESVGSGELRYGRRPGSRWLPGRPYRELVAVATASDDPSGGEDATARTLEACSHLARRVDARAATDST